MSPEDRHADLMLMLGRIEQKIDSHLAADDLVHAAHTASLHAAHKRIDEHDKFRARVKGGTAVLGALAAVVSTAVLAFPKYFGG